MKKLTAEQVRLLADNLLPTFIPKDENETSLIFHFTVAGKNYKVAYEKPLSHKSWNFVGYEEVEGI